MDGGLEPVPSLSALGASQVLEAGGSQAGALDR
jgi:hypothetical protein